MNNQMTNTIVVSTLFVLEWFQWIIVIVLGFLGVAINQLLMLANILSTPTVNSMVRVKIYFLRMIMTLFNQDSLEFYR